MPRANILAAIAAPLAYVVSVGLMPVIILGAAVNSSRASELCGAMQTITGVTLDGSQLANARTIVTVTATRHLPAYAAVVAVATALTESGLRNSTVETDHDSEGLFQQRISIYTQQVADDPAAATGAFLDRLVGVPNWQTNPVGIDAQTVQASAYPDRYQPHALLAQQLVGQFWPAAAATTGIAQTGGTVDADVIVPQPVCAGGGPAGSIAGPTGNNVAGTTTIPTGFVISGSPQAQTAIRFALSQLGKPYLYAGAGPDEWDCSGLTMAAWAAAGIALPHNAAAQQQLGTPQPRDLSTAVGGDLVFIPGADGTAVDPGHVGMIAGYLDAPDGRHLYLVQAPMTGLRVELTEATEWAGQIVAVRHFA
jgi:cell wall-associated NlpC family hydrolase